jgi:hypothetical protein
VSPEPDDGHRRGGPEDARGRRDTDEFDAIVAGWDRTDDVGADEPGPAAAAPAAADPEGHFVPPEPPPLPRLGPPAVVGFGLLALGLVLCVWPTLIGVPSAYGVPLGLVTLAAGLGWLVLRLWPDPPPAGDGHGEDDGAVL